MTDNHASRIPLSTPPTKPTNWWKTLPGQAAILAMLAGLVVILLGVFGAIGPRADRNSLAGTDPAGATACDMLANWLPGDSSSEASIIQTVATQAANATTYDIKRSSGLATMRLASVADVRAACVAAGVHMPPLH